jgi:multidrug efflux pump subunit AcrA (membrane-fusion protein)
MQKTIVCLCVAALMTATAWAEEPLVVKEARQNITLSGYTRGRTKQALASEVAGKVVKVHYDVGQTVGPLPFVEIDPTFIDFQIAQAQQALEKLKLAKSRNASQTDFLQKEFERADALHRDNVAPLARWEAAAEQLTQARLALQTTEAEISSLNIQLKELKERRARHRVMAPAGWVIVQRRVEPGEIIAAGTPLGQAADFTKLVVPLFVSGQELAAIEQLKSIAVRVEGQPARAKINWINPEFDERTRKLAIELVVLEYRGAQRGGLLTELTIEVAAGGLMVPKAAVVQRYDNPAVVLKADGRTVPVSILGENGEHILINQTAALRPGMELQAPTATP